MNAVKWEGSSLDNKNESQNQILYAKKTSL